MMINLYEKYGDTYKIIFDEAHEKRYKNPKLVDPWLYVIPCKYGDISPHTKHLLAWYCEGHPRIRKRVKALPFMDLFTEGDRDICLLFHPVHFHELAQIVHPRRIPVISEEERERRRLAFSQHRKNEQKLDPFSPHCPREVPRVP